MSNMKYVRVEYIERVADCYCGEGCDEVEPRWKIPCDKEAPEITDEDLSLDSSLFPPGTRIVVEEPLCPKCSERMWVCEDDVECSFSWETWEREQYS